MQRFCFSKIFGFGCIIAVVMLASSCVSHSPTYDMQAFGTVGTDADVYIFTPVAENEPLLKALLTAFVPEKTAMQYLNRTSALYIGIDYGLTPSITVVSAGSYPVSLGDLLFSKKDGWEKRRAAALNNYTYYSSAAADIMVREKAAFMLFGSNQRNPESFFQRIANPHSPVFPPRFQALSDSVSVGEIGLYARSGSSAASALLGLDDIELPIRSIEFYLKKDMDSMYRCSAVFEANNPRAASVVRLLLNQGMSGDFSIQDASVFVENADITETELIEMLLGITSAALIK